ncbi:MAG TPA: hypothetical protein VG148_19255 [Pyrinomonadaceae bacterium]|nr:hypothetical protein [Pyrinomonadaceae bacterium]
MSFKQTAQQYLGRLGTRLQEAKLRLRQGGFSNFDEEKIIGRFAAELLTGVGPRTAVDIGAGDGIKGSNTYALFRQGWRGLGVEGDPRRARRLAHAYRELPGVAACHARVTPSDVVGLLESQGVGREFDLLSLDIDSYDYWVLDAILGSFRPRLVVTEINEKIPPPIRFVVRYDPDFRLQHHFFGYSIASLEDLCARHSYALIALEYNNAFLAPRELPGVRPLDFTEAYRRGYLERADRRERFHRNLDMEALHAMSPEEGVEFIRRFFARHEGKYDLGLAETPEEVSSYGLRVSS